MQSGEDLLARTAVENNILDRMARIEAELARLKQQDVQAGTLAEMSSDAGDITAGRFICASSDTTEPTDPAFSGSFMSAGGESFGSDTYHVGGVNSGVFQAGFSSTTGKLLATSGYWVVGREGQTIYQPNNYLKFVPTSGANTDTNGTREGNLFGYCGETTASLTPPPLKLLSHAFLSPLEPNELTNGNFSSGDLTGWTANNPTYITVVDYNGGKAAKLDGQSGLFLSLESDPITVDYGKAIWVQGYIYNATIEADSPNDPSRYAGDYGVFGIKTSGGATRIPQIWPGQNTFSFVFYPQEDCQEVSIYVDVPYNTSDTYVTDFIVRQIDASVVEFPADDSAKFARGVKFGYANTSGGTKYAKMLYDGTTDRVTVTDGGTVSLAHTGDLDPSVLSERSVAPTAPASGYRNLYGMSNGLFDQSSGGTISRLVSAAAQLDAPAAVVAGTPTTGGAVTVGTHSYKTTYYDSYGETTPSAKSNVVTVANTTNDRVPLTIPLGPAGTVGRRIYRTVAGDTGDWKLLVDIADNTTTTYNDDIADAALGAAAPTTNTTAGRPVFPRNTIIQAEEFYGVPDFTFTNSQVLGYYKQNNSAADGDTYHAWFYADAGADYEVGIFYVKANNAGKMNMFIDGAAIDGGTAFDMYAASTTYNQTKYYTSLTIGQAGMHRITIKANGKNGSSSSYRMPFTMIEIKRASV